MTKNIESWSDDCFVFMIWVPVAFRAVVWVSFEYRNRRSASRVAPGAIPAVAGMTQTQSGSHHCRHPTRHPPDRRRPIAAPAPATPAWGWNCRRLDEHDRAPGRSGARYRRVAQGDDGLRRNELSTRRNARATHPGPTLFLRAERGNRPPPAAPGPSWIFACSSCFEFLVPMAASGSRPAGTPSTHSNRGISNPIFYNTQDKFY